MPSTDPLPRAEDIQVIVCDVDGTLLNSHHVLPPSSPTFTILRRIRATHPELPIVISTGKQYPAAASLRLALDLAPFPACHLNGNVVYAPTGAILHETTLALPVVEQVFAACRDAGVSLFLYDRERVYHVLPFKTFTDAQAESLLRAYGEDVVELAEAEEVMRKVHAGETKVTKMGVCEVEEYIPNVRKLLATFPPSSFALTQALTFCLELIPATDNKGTALVHALAHLNATRAPGTREMVPAGVIAFGDGGNDVPMFEVAGMSVAMGNAMPDARAKARWVTDTNDVGGVGTFLQKVFFPDE